MRDTYEHPGAPRPKRLGREFIDPSGPVPRASSSERSPSFRPLGFVWNALAKGYRLGFIASSDHISGHVSYACVIAERLSRESLFEAMRARRTYGATDNIVLDVRFVAAGGAEHLMGEEFASAEPVRVQVRVLGTGPIERVEVDQGWPHRLFSGAGRLGGPVRICGRGLIQRSVVLLRARDAARWGDGLGFAGLGRLQGCSTRDESMNDSDPANTKRHQ